MNNKCLMVIGLSLNLLSVIVLFFMPYPPADFGPAGLIQLEDANVLENGKSVLQENKAREARKKRYKNVSLIAFTTMLVGFGLQLWSVLITP